MPHQYNLTNLTEASDFVDLLKYANEVTSDVFGLLLLFIIFFVFFGASNYIGTKIEKTFVVASFTTTISSILLYIQGLVSVTVCIGLLALLLISVFIAGRARE